MSRMRLLASQLVGALSTVNHRMKEAGVLLDANVKGTAVLEMAYENFGSNPVPNPPSPRALPQAAGTLWFVSLT